MVAITAVVVTAFAGYSVNKSLNNSNAELSDLTLANIEALAQDEGGGGKGKHTPNFRRATVWYRSGFGFGSGITIGVEPSWYLQIGSEWKSIVCCVNGADMDACDFSLEESDCAKKVIRNK